MAAAAGNSGARAAHGMTWLRTATASQPPAGHGVLCCGWPRFLPCGRGFGKVCIFPLPLAGDAAFKWGLGSMGFPFVALGKARRENLAGEEASPDGEVFVPVEVWG